MNLFAPLLGPQDVIVRNSCHASSSELHGKKTIKVKRFLVGTGT